MTLKDIAAIRLSSQHIADKKLKSAKEIVGWMGAMQAQDYAMAKWAMGVRLADSTEQFIEKAIDEGEIIRTHVLRPTWHLVSPDDISWMLELTAPQIKTLMNSNNKVLELTESIYTKSNAIIEKALSSGNHLTREELMMQLQRSKIATDDNRASHLMLRAELDKIVCSGAIKNKKQTYALFAERIPNPKILTKEEALEKLARKYFSSHCPATLNDFIWWSGLSVKQAKNALELIKNDFVSETIDSETYWFANSFSMPATNEPTVYLLPAFDEFIISYKNRTASLTTEYQKRAFTNNGIFRPVIVVNGQVTGLWKRTFKKEQVILETELFHPLSKSIKGAIEKVAELYGHFLDKEVEVAHRIH